MSAGSKKKGKPKNYFLILANNDNNRPESDVEVVRVDKIIPISQIPEKLEDANKEKEAKRQVAEGVDMVEFVPLRGEHTIRNVQRGSLFHPESASSKLWAQVWLHTKANFSVKHEYQKEWIDLCTGPYFRPCSVCESTREDDFEELTFCLLCGLPLHRDCEPTEMCSDCRDLDVAFVAKKTVTPADVMVGEQEYLVLLPEDHLEKPTLVLVTSKLARDVQCKLVFSEGQEIVKKPFNVLAHIQDISDKQLYDLYHVGQSAVEEGIGPFEKSKGENNSTSEWNEFLRESDEGRCFCVEHDCVKDMGCQFCYRFFCDECLGAEYVEEEVSSDKAREAKDIHNMCLDCYLHNDRAFFKREHDFWDRELNFRLEEIGIAKEHPSKFVIDEPFSDGDLDSVAKEVRKTGSRRKGSVRIAGSDKAEKLPGRKVASAPLPRRQRGHARVAKPLRGSSKTQDSVANMAGEERQSVDQGDVPSMSGKITSSKRGRDEEEPRDEQPRNQRQKASSGSPSKQPEQISRSSKKDAEQPKSKPRKVAQGNKEKEEENEVDGGPPPAPILQESHRSNGRKRGPASQSKAQSQRKAPKRTREAAEANQPQPAPAPNADEVIKKKRGPAPKATRTGSNAKQKTAVKPTQSKVVSEPRRNERANADGWDIGSLVEVFRLKDFSYYVGIVLEPGHVQIDPFGIDSKVRLEQIFPVRNSEPNEDYREGDAVDVQLKTHNNSWWEAVVIEVNGSRVKVAFRDETRNQTVSKRQLRRNKRT